MKAINRILVPRDFSPCSETALRTAVRLAERTGATLHLLFAHVLHDEAGGPPISSAAHDQNIRTQLHRFASGEPLGIEEERVVVHVVRDLAAPPAILHYAEANEIDLIVLGTHGRRGVRRLLLGSVAEEVVQLAQCPVLTTHAQEAPALGDEDTSILVPVDFSVHAQEALQQAKAMAALYDARLDLLHVIEERMQPAFYNAGAVSVYDLVPNLDEEVLDQLKRFYEESGATGAPVRFRVVPGRAANEIARYAEEAGSALIVLSTHGLTGIEHLLIGSISEKVVRLAPCPVLTVKAKQTPYEQRTPAPRPKKDATVRSVDSATQIGIPA